MRSLHAAIKKAKLRSSGKYLDVAGQHALPQDQQAGISRSFHTPYQSTQLLISWGDYTRLRHDFG